jgi:DNA-binding transcriptional regulator YiaG
LVKIPGEPSPTPAAAPEKELSNQLLTDVVLKDNMRVMQDEMRKLRARLTKATAARNQKAALAKWLGVSLSSVSTWLAGRKEPSGETTLRLLQWVEHWEAQQKQNPGGVSAPQGPKTQ